MSCAYGFGGSPTPNYTSSLKSRASKDLDPVKVGLQRVGEFYQSNADVIERHRVPTIDFETGKETQRRYTRAKVIDMIFFVEGGN